jgi:hypothetical protein
MKLAPLIYISCMCIALVACNATAPTQVANIACIGAQTGASVAVAVTADVSVAANPTKAATQAQATAAAQKTVGDVCPLLVSGVSAMGRAGVVSSNGK